MYVARVCTGIAEYHHAESRTLLIELDLSFDYKSPG
jgi:hypothetical protein